MSNKPIRIFQMNVDRLSDIMLGRETENHAAAVEINLSRWLSIWPDGIATIWLLRPGENTRYPAVTEREGDVIRWLVSDYDMALPGVARMEVTLQDGENIAISAAAFVTIAHRIGKTEGEAGEMEPDWSKNVIEKTAENAERAEDAAKRAQQIVDEFEPGEGGGITNETDPTVPEWAKQPEKPTYTAEEVGAQPKGDYALKSEIPSIPVQSVNGKTGKVELTAEDVGALPEDTIIPAPYELPTASADVKGGVKVGNGLQMDGDVLGVKPEGVYELIETITLEEDMVIERTQEPNGKPYAFTALKIFIDSTAAKFEGTNVWINFNNGWSSPLWLGGFSTNPNFDVRRSCGEFIKQNGDWYGKSLANAMKGVVASPSETMYEYDKNYNHIVGMWMSAAIPANSTVIIKGVRA